MREILPAGKPEFSRVSRSSFPSGEDEPTIAMLGACLSLSVFTSRCFHGRLIGGRRRLDRKFAYHLLKFRKRSGPHVSQCKKQQHFFGVLEDESNQNRCRHEHNARPTRNKSELFEVVVPDRAD